MTEDLEEKAEKGLWERYKESRKKTHIGWKKGLIGGILGTYLALVAAAAGNLTWNLWNYSATRENLQRTALLQRKSDLVKNPNKTDKEIDEVYDSFVYSIFKVSLGDETREGKLKKISSYVNSSTLNGLVPSFEAGSLEKISFPEKLFYDGEIPILMKDQFNFFLKHPSREADINPFNGYITIPINNTGVIHPKDFLLIAHELGHLRYNQLLKQDKINLGEFCRLNPPKMPNFDSLGNSSDSFRAREYTPEERYVEAYTNAISSINSLVSPLESPDKEVVKYGVDLDRDKEGLALDFALLHAVHGEDLGGEKRISPSQVDLKYLDRKDAPALYAECFLSPFYVAKHITGYVDRAWNDAKIRREMRTNIKRDESRAANQTFYQKQGGVYTRGKRR